MSMPKVPSKEWVTHGPEGFLSECIVQGVLGTKVNGSKNLILIVSIVSAFFFNIQMYTLNLTTGEIMG